jgi:hypothetical protein
MNVENIEEIKTYIEWLEECLIADLERDGYEATADDFKTLAAIVKLHVLNK